MGGSLDGMDSTEEAQVQGKVSIAGDVILMRIITLIYGVISILIVVLGLTSFQFNMRVIIGIVVIAVGFLLGFVGIMLGTFKLSENPIVPSLNSLLVVASVVFFISGVITIVYGNKDFMDTGKMNVLSFVVIIAAAMFILAYIESMHAVLQFTGIAEYAASHNLVEFTVKPVITNYLVWSMILYFFVLAFTTGIVFMDFLLKIIISVFSPQFAESVDLNSVYSLAITMFIIFVPLLAILTFIFGASKKKVAAKNPGKAEEFEVAK
jgi:hypothetical protein